LKNHRYVPGPSFKICKLHVYFRGQVLVTILVIMAPYGRKLCKQSFIYYGNPEDFTKIVCYARFGCLTSSDKAVQGHTAYTTGGAVQTAQLRFWTEVECTLVRLPYRAERQLHVSIAIL
jgi:hypothetical protein